MDQKQQRAMLQKWIGCQGDAGVRRLVHVEPNKGAPWQARASRWGSKRGMGSQGELDFSAADLAPHSKTPLSLCPTDATGGPTNAVPIHV